jgi:predicted Zn-dependent protease
VAYRFQLGNALSRNPLWRRRALVQYREALDLDPVREEVLGSFAELLLTEKRFAAALEVARRLAAHFPKSPRSQEILARCRGAAPDEPGEVGRMIENGRWIPSSGFRDTPH